MRLAAGESLLRAKVPCLSGVRIASTDGSSRFTESAEVGQTSASIGLQKLKKVTETSADAAHLDDSVVLLVAVSSSRPRRECPASDSNYSKYGRKSTTARTAWCFVLLESQTRPLLGLL